MSPNESSSQTKPFNFLAFALAVFVVAISIAGLYYVKFSANGASGDPASWAQFGDYFGGVLNPLIGLFTILILAMTLRINSDQLEQSRTEVKLSQEALKVAMEELKRGQELQELTEKSLREQIETMSLQHDISSAVNLAEYWKFLSEQAEAAAKSATTTEIRNKRRAIKGGFDRRRAELDEILSMEYERLISKYFVEKPDSEDSSISSK